MKAAIKEARLHRGLTQVQLAALLNIPQPRIAEWESGKYTPDPGNIKKLERALNGKFIVMFNPED